MERERDDTGEQQPWSYSCGFMASFTWPPRSYPCSFCKREFRSAQALGGHMNVHRRDRARLRQCYSAYHPSPLPNPSPTTHHRSPAPLPNLNFYPPPHCNAEPVIYSFFSATVSATTPATKAAFEVDLELEIGPVCSGGDPAEEDGLDLELRLGC